MKRVLIAGLFVLSLAANAAAQAPVLPGDRLGWDQVATDLAEVRSFSFVIRIDNLAPVVLTPAQVTCTAATAANTFTCVAPFPAATPGTQHALTVAARATINNETVESAQSAPFVFRFFVISAPTGVRRLPGS